MISLRHLIAGVCLAASAMLVVQGQGSFPWHLYPHMLGTPYCATRDEGKCCSGRNDSCALPMADTKCYCDLFCDRRNSDCCPDFVDHCLGGDDSLESHKAAFLKISGKAYIDNNCNHEGRRYRPGDMIYFNCNNCTCVYAVLREEYNWQCSQRVCLVTQVLLNRINKGDFGWKATNYTFLWGHSLQDGRTYRLGTKRPLLEVTRMTALSVNINAKFPEHFDAREKWPGLVSDVMDQGDCASSWAFSTISVASDRLAIHSGGRVRIALSAQQFISCNTVGQNGCQGGHLDRAWWFLRTKGVVDDSCYPYRSGDTGKQEACAIPQYRTRATRVRCPTGKGWSRVYRVTPTYRIAPIEREIMKEIMDNGPVQAVMAVNEDFFVYQGGVYRYSMPARPLPPNFTPKPGFHSVKIIGWGTDRTTNPPLNYWLCANSWGPRWGENGYFRIVRGINECEIESFVLGVWCTMRYRRSLSEDFIFTPSPGSTPFTKSPTTDDKLPDGFVADQPIDGSDSGAQPIKNQNSGTLPSGVSYSKTSTSKDDLDKPTPTGEIILNKNSDGDAFTDSYTGILSVIKNLEQSVNSKHKGNSNDWKLPESSQNASTNEDSKIQMTQAYDDSSSVLNTENNWVTTSQVSYKNPLNKVSDSVQETSQASLTEDKKSAVITESLSSTETSQVNDHSGPQETQVVSTVTNTANSETQTAVAVKNDTDTFKNNSHTSDSFNQKVGDNNNMTVPDSTESTIEN